MTTIARPVLLPALLLAALALPLAPRAVLADSAVAAAPAPARITVSGLGRTEARPDMATITLGVQTEAATAAAALRENSARLAAVLDRLRAAGIADRDLQTSGLNLGPVYDHRPDRQAPRISGYQAGNMLTVRVRDLSALGSILDLVVEDGANAFHGLSFALSDPQAALDAARTAAVRDARRKAEMLAEAAGVRLGAVIEISESSGHADPRPMMRMAAEAVAMDVPVAEGEISYAVNVNVIWALTSD